MFTVNKLLCSYSLLLLAVFLALVACQPGTSSAPASESSNEAALAADALRSFFDLLEAGEYPEAAAHYGGSVEVLQGYNPEVDPSDTATLFRNACSVNGFSCLKVREVTLAEQEAAEYVFDVTFSTREGELFVLGPCCGATESEQPPVSVFPIRVARGEDGRFRVLDLPPYRP